MEESLARETQIVETQDLAPELGSDVATLSSHAQELIHRCMDGTEDMTGAKPWHVKKLNASHIQMLMLRAAGFKPAEISQMIGYEVQAIAQLMTHPYAKKIFKALVPDQYTRVIDIRTRMEAQASELMDKLFGMTFVSDDIKEVKDVTFGFLDRAGYNAVNKGVAVTATPKDLREAGESALSRLATAMDESNLVDSVVMPNYRPSKPPEEGSRAGSRKFDLEGIEAGEGVGSSEVTQAAVSSSGNAVPQSQPEVVNG